MNSDFKHNTHGISRLSNLHIYHKSCHSQDSHNVSLVCQDERYSQDSNSLSAIVKIPTVFSGFDCNRTTRKDPLNHKEKGQFKSSNGIECTWILAPQKKLTASV